MTTTTRPDGWKYVKTMPWWSKRRLCRTDTVRFKTKSTPHGITRS